MGIRWVLVMGFVLGGMVQADAAVKNFSDCWVLPMRAGYQDIAWVCGKTVSQIDLYAIQGREFVLVDRLQGEVTEEHNGVLGSWILVEAQSESYSLRLHWALRPSPIGYGVLRYADGHEVSFGSSRSRPQPPVSCKVGVPCH